MENQTPESNVPNEEQKVEIKIGWRELFSKFMSLIHDVANIRDEVDYNKTLESVRKDIVFKGYNIWILIASIFIASIGLNANAVAVIIGAMLISPLMGPIVGIGMSMATNNWSLLTRSLKNMAVFVIVSIITSAIYFAVTPLGDAASELESRIHPNFLDVLVAFFGGVAGIVAGSRKEKTNVIPGVAIATALMPPLCTAGYGLANLNSEFFFGAFYLFLINCVFIALSTFLVSRYLRFPRFNYIDPARERKAKMYFFICLVLFIVPSFYTLYTTYVASQFKTNVGLFIDNEIKTAYTVLDVTSELEAKKIDVITSEYVGPKEKDVVLQKLHLYDLEGYELKITPVFDMEKLSGIIDERASNANVLPVEIVEMIASRDRKIQEQEKALTRLKGDTIPFVSLSKEVKSLFPDIQKFSYQNKSVVTNFSMIDTVATVTLKWNNSRPEKDEQKLIDWLKIKMKADTISVLYYK